MQPPPPLPPILPPSSTAPREGGLGCAAKGCLVLFIVGLLFAGVAGGIAFWAWSQARGLTADHAESVPVMEATDAQAADVAARVKAFGDTVRRGGRATLMLSADDLNAVVARDPKYRDARGRVFFTIKKDALHTRVSIPLDKIPTMKGRWFNGEAGLYVSLADGELALKLVSLEYGGKPVPRETLRRLSSPEAMEQLNESLRERMRRDPKLSESLRRVESIDIKDDKLVIVGDGGGDAKPDDADDKEKA